MEENTTQKLDLFEEIKEKVMKNVIDLDSNSLQKSINDSLRYANENAEKNIDGKRNVNHMIFEMNEFYIEMAEKLRELRFECIKDFEDFESVSTYSEDLCKSLEKYGDPVEIRKQLEIMKKLDIDIDNKYKDLKTERDERFEIESEICEILKNDVELDTASQKFVKLCEQMNSPKPSPEPLTGINEENKKLPNKAKEEAKFIKRNIDLANSKAMANISLTDEEKMKLETLLSEETGNEVDDDKPTGIETEVTKEYETVLSNNQIGYNFEESELSRLSELETQLQTLSETNMTSEASVVSLASSVSTFEDIERDEKERKYWKTDQRLKKIEDELKIMVEERERVDLNAIRVEVDIQNLVEDARRDLLKIIETEEIIYQDEEENEEQLNAEIEEPVVEPDQGAEETKEVQEDVSE